MPAKKRKIWNMVLNTFLIIGALLIIFVPSAKALLLTALINIGILTPSKPTENRIAIQQEVTFKNAGGDNISLSALRGKVVFINFWATWCPPCIAEMPSIQKLYNTYKNDKNVVFLLVDADNNFKKSERFMSRKKMDLPVYQATSSIPDYIFKGALPTTLVIDKYGKMVYHGTGAADYSNTKFINLLKKLSEE